MRQLRILVDMDDTIEHLLLAWVNCLNERYGTAVRCDDIREWNISTAFPTLTKEQVYAPLVEDDFWKTVQPIDGAADVLKWAIGEGHEVYIVTTSSYHALKSKMENVLFRHFPFIAWEQVIITSNKQVIRGDILIDDAPHNLVNGSYVKVLMTAPHNRDYDAKRNHMIRVHTWDEVKGCIKKLSMTGGTN